MRGRPWYKRYGADFIHGCMGLSLEEKGAYSLCLDLIYDRGGPIPDDARWLAGVCGVSVRKWGALRARLIEAGKLTSRDGSLTNERAENEIEIAAKTARKLAENGAKGGANSHEKDRTLNETSDLEEAGLKHTRINQRLEAREEENKCRSGPGLSRPEREGTFGLFQKAYPRRDGSQDWPKAREIFDRAVKAGVDPQAMISAAERYAADARRRGDEGSKFIKQARTWLNGRLWEEYSATPPDPPKSAAPAGWPPRLPDPETCFSAWNRGSWPQAWGFPPGDPDCPLPPAIVSDWQRRRDQAA